MKRLLNLSVVLLCIFVSACKKEKAAPVYTDPAFHPKGNLSDLVHNPVRPDGSIDSSYLPVMTFRDTLYEFGTVQEGDIITKEFTFTNTGTAPLIITEAKSTCGCTIPEWPRGPIAPDSSGVITVRFNTLHRTGSQSKEVTIFANTFPNQAIVWLKGMVKEK